MNTLHDADIIANRDVDLSARTMTSFVFRNLGVKIPAYMTKFSTRSDSHYCTQRLASSTADPEVSQSFSDDLRASVLQYHCASFVRSVVSMRADVAFLALFVQVITPGARIGHIALQNIYATVAGS